MESYDWPHVDWDKLHKHRTETVSRIMAENECDALILTCFDNIRYSTNYRSMLAVESNDVYGAILTREQEAYLFTPWKGEHKKPFQAMPWVRESIGIPSWSPSIYQSSIWSRLLSRKLDEIGAKSVGIDDIPFQVHEKIREKKPGVTFKSLFSNLFDARSVKHPEEIKLIEQTADILAAGANRGFETICASMTEFELMSQIFSRIYEQGAEFVTHNLCIHERTSMDYFPEDRLILEGDTVVFDIGCFGKGGYAGDMTRTAFVGTPPREVREAYNILLEAYMKGVRSLRPGVKASEIDALVNQVMVDAGYTETPYAMGHGIGMRLIEHPHIYGEGRSVDDPVLREGMVVAIEPEITTKARGRDVTSKLEDVIVVTQSGGRVLTHSPYSIET